MPEIIANKSYGKNSLFSFIHTVEPSEIIDPDKKKYYLKAPIITDSVFLEAVKILQAKAN